MIISFNKHINTVAVKILMGYKLSNIITANRLMVGYIYHYCTTFKFIKLLVSSKSNRVQKCAGESNTNLRGD